MVSGLDASNSREIILTELIFACSRALSQRGMTGMFLDGVSAGEREIIPLGKPLSLCWAVMILVFLTYTVIGFQKWMQYKDVWREMSTT
jgi:hypothetical protein